MFNSKRIRVGLSLLASATALMLLFSLSFSDEGKNEHSDDVGQITTLEKEWSNKFAEGDLEWIMNLHSEDAVQLPPGGSLIQGKEALQAAWAGMIGTEGLTLTWESTAAFVSKSGDMAYDYGKGLLTNPDGTSLNAKYLVVWTKVGGDWKVVADMFNMSGASE